jgi:hypothetical protein
VLIQSDVVLASTPFGRNWLHADGVLPPSNEQRRGRMGASHLLRLVDSDPAAIVLMRGWLPTSSLVATLA